MGSWLKFLQHVELQKLLSYGELNSNHGMANSPCNIYPRDKYLGKYANIILYICLLIHVFFFIQYFRLFFNYPPLFFKIFWNQPPSSKFGGRVTHSCCIFRNQRLECAAPKRCSKYTTHSACAVELLCGSTMCGCKVWRTLQPRFADIWYCMNKTCRLQLKFFSTFCSNEVGISAKRKWLNRVTLWFCFSTQFSMKLTQGSIL